MSDTEKTPETTATVSPEIQKLINANDEIDLRNVIFTDFFEPINIAKSTPEKVLHVQKLMIPSTLDLYLSKKDAILNTFANKNAVASPFTFFAWYLQGPDDLTPEHAANVDSITGEHIFASPKYRQQWVELFERGIPRCDPDMIILYLKPLMMETDWSSAPKNKVAGARFLLQLLTTQQMITAIDKIKGRSYFYEDEVVELVKFLTDRLGAPERDRIKDRIVFFHKNFTTFYEKYAPYNLHRVDLIAEKVAGMNADQEKAFLEQVYDKFDVKEGNSDRFSLADAPPAAPAPGTPVPPKNEKNVLPPITCTGLVLDYADTEKIRLLQRLQLFYSKYNPEKLTVGPDKAVSMRVAEETLFGMLCSKYHVDPTIEAKEALAAGVYPCSEST